MKKNTILLTTLILSASMAMPTAAAWEQHGETWKYRESDNIYTAGGWKWIDGNQDGTAECYCFDQDGRMLAGTTTPDGYQVDANGAWMENGQVMTKQVQVKQVQVSPIGSDGGCWRRGNGQNADRWWFDHGNGTYANSGWFWLDGNSDGVAECYYFDASGWLVVNGTTPDGYQVDANGAWTQHGVVQTKQVKAAGKIVAGVSGGSGSSSSGGSGSSSSNKNTVVSDSAWSGYSDSSVGKAANDFTNGNWRKMTSDQQAEVTAAIDEFKAAYITSDMSDFEKEMMIIQWLVENCSYGKGENWENATAYSCIVNGEAQCSGYADAFLQTAKACGLEARYVYNNTHAWNLLKLDGEWYHVDVTWEDPVGENTYGFGKLRNRYINLEDSQIGGVVSHRSWSPNSTKANGYKYGPAVVARYMEKGIVDTSVGESYKAKVEARIAEAVNDDGTNSLVYTTVSETAAGIVDYFSSLIEARESRGTVVIRYSNGYKASVTGNYSKLVAVNNQIEELVMTQINEKYQDILRNKFRINLFLEVDADEQYFVIEECSMYYTKESSQTKPAVASPTVADRQ